MILISLFGGLAAVTLLQRAPDAAPTDIVAGATAVRNTAVGILAVCGFLLFSAGMALKGSPGAWLHGIATSTVFVIYGCYANYVLFGSWRPEHTLGNAVVAAVIVWLLLKGR